MASVINATGHGLSAGDTFRFANVLPTNSGIDEATTYYVLAAGLTADAFTFSETAGGTAFVLTYAITDGSIVATDVYEIDTDGIQNPPTAPATPAAPTVSSSLITDAAGLVIVHLKVTVVAPEATVRSQEVATTREYSGGSPVWTNAVITTLAPGVTTLSMPALGSTGYAVRTRNIDVFGTATAWSSVTEHTTTAGPDSVAVTNDGATVTIDDTGIHIADGSLFVEDEFGSNVVTAQGFEGTWADFLGSGVYNALLARGTVGSITAGRTAALPYWTVGTITDCAVTYEANTSWPGGHRVVIDPSSTSASVAFTSDLVPVTPYQWYLPGMVYGWVRSTAGTLTVKRDVKFYKEDGTTQTGVTDTLTNSIAVDNTFGPALVVSDASIQAPVDAHYAAVIMTFTETVGDNAANRLYWGGVTLAEYVPNDLYTPSMSTDSFFATTAEVGSGGLAMTSGGDINVGDGGIINITSTSDGNILLKFLMDRPWTFEQESTGATTALVLRPAFSGKTFKIIALDDGEVPFAVTPLDGSSASRVAMDTQTLLDTGGTAFPSPATAGDRYYRTDFRMDFEYDGTRWTCTCPHTAQDMIGATAGGTIPYTATTTNGNQRVPFYLMGGSDIWVEDLSISFYVSGGTALSASHKWVLTTTKNLGGGSLTTVTISSGASSAWRQTVTAVDALLGSTVYIVDHLWTKTGTPGNLYAFCVYTYRIVAT